MKKNNSIFNKIIIMRTDRIGEVLLSTAAVDSIKKRYPESRISFLTSEYSKPLLEGRNDIEKILITDTFSKTGTFAKAVKLSNLLKKGSFDTAIILNPHKILHLASFLAGIPYRLGFDRKWGFLLNIKKRDDRDEGQKHELQYTMDLLHLISGDLEICAPRIVLDDVSNRKFTGILEQKGITGKRPLLAIHPGSSNISKLWGIDRYAELIKRLKSDLDCDIVILAEEKERTITSYIIGRSGASVIDLTGELDLKELACVLSKSSLFIGNDAGPMHMAAALGIPLIAIFGKNDPGVGPRRWGPWGTRSIVFHKDPGCRPCYGIKCVNDYKCMSMVTVEMVFDGAVELLGPWVK